MRRSFDRDLTELREEVRLMGTMVDYSMQQTHEALAKHDFYLASIIRKADIGVNSREKKIEQLCIRLLTLQQPLASDLRHITATIRLVADLERIGDQCADICEILCTYPEAFDAMPTPQMLLDMLDDARTMLRNAMKAFLTQDEKLAREVIEMDDQVDMAFSEIVRSMCKNILDHNVLITQSTDYMFMAKYIERMGDHSVNIAGWAIYAVTSELPARIDADQDKEAIRAFLTRAEAHGHLSPEEQIAILDHQIPPEERPDVESDPMMPGIGRRSWPKGDQSEEH